MFFLAQELPITETGQLLQELSDTKALILVLILGMTVFLVLLGILIYVLKMSTQEHERDDQHDNQWFELIKAIQEDFRNVVEVLKEGMEKAGEALQEQSEERQAFMSYMESHEANAKTRSDSLRQLLKEQTQKWGALLSKTKPIPKINDILDENDSQSGDQSKIS